MGWNFTDTFRNGANSDLGFRASFGFRGLGLRISDPVQPPPGVEGARHSMGCLLRRLRQVLRTIGFDIIGHFWIFLVGFSRIQSDKLPGELTADEQVCPARAALPVVVAVPM